MAVVSRLPLNLASLPKSPEEKNRFRASHQQNNKRNKSKPGARGDKDAVLQGVVKRCARAGDGGGEAVGDGLAVAKTRS